MAEMYKKRYNKALSRFNQTLDVDTNNIPPMDQTMLQHYFDKAQADRALKLQEQQVINEQQK